MSFVVALYLLWVVCLAFEFIELRFYKCRQPYKYNAVNLTNWLKWWRPFSSASKLFFFLDSRDLAVFIFLMLFAYFKDPLQKQDMVPCEQSYI